MSSSEGIRFGVTGSLQTAAAAVVYNYQLNNTGSVNKEIFHTWQKLKQNLPAGPYAIAQVMQIIELHLLENSIGGEEEDPLILRANDLFKRLVSTLFTPLSNFNLLNECSMPVTEALLCRMQERFQSVENGAMLKIWDRLVELHHFPGIAGGHEAIRAWLQDPEHAEQIQAITTLDLRGLNLGFLPAEIGLFTSLQILDLRNNNLHSLPESLGNLTSLTSLNLERNQLSVLPVSFGNLSDLKILNLESNLLFTLPSPITQLKALNILSLCHNQLETLPHEFGNLSNLIHLHLNHNRLTSLPPSMKYLQKLTRLECYHNRLTTLPEEICRLAALKELNLWQNKLTSLPESIGDLQSLESLSINHNKISSLPQSIGSLSALRTFRFNNNNITEFPLQIRQASHLTKVNLSFNQITTLPDSVFEMESTVFNVDGNPLMFISDETLKDDFCKYVTPAALFPQYAKSFNHTCLSPLATLFQAIIRNESTEALQQVFEKLDPSTQQQIIANASEDAFIFNPTVQRTGLRAQTWHLTSQFLDSCQTSSLVIPTLRDQVLFDDKTRFARAVRKTAYTNYRLLASEEIESVHSHVRRLAGKLESDWGKEHLFDHMLRFIDALEMVRGLVDFTSPGPSASSSGSRIGNSIKKLFLRK